MTSGAHHQDTEAFITWASRYDGARPAAELVAEIMRAIGARP